MMQDGELTHLGALSAGPVPQEELIAWRPPDIIYDDISGAPLDPVKVAKAQQFELDWIHDPGVYPKVDIGECCQETGKKPITLKWINTNKGDEARPNYRSRLVVREIKRTKSPEETLPAETLFSAMPPLEAFKIH